MFGNYLVQQSLITFGVADLILMLHFSLFKYCNTQILVTQTALFLTSYYS